MFYNDIIPTLLLPMKGISPISARCFFIPGDTDGTYECYVMHCNMVNSKSFFLPVGDGN